MNKLVLDFNDVKHENLSIIGGEAYHLTKLLKKNFPVPQGFIVTTNCFQSFLEQNFLYFLHRSLTKNLSLKDTFYIASNLRHKVIKGKIPKKLKKIIAGKIDKFNFDSVSVRSSATVEDGHNGSSND
ncbi:hypothetical protein COS31_00810 [Candidatus Roizmanbacteria bacterium CG02_land_8_20_14_3_00_36_15]|nr:MAG: hypothetical protein COS51_01375 [Candidatus Roizmanbacteria bacterium CG03_land_8_20_14_0_80_36_21]PIV38152.1 MAG: hypothetical protein COS31_00810 [Candidatus Roizmanbacteria bacterium CG02_land_8_20_14_3_00_36_15]PIY69612.1 MAG: hypothetical protein COY89_05600 [Candidatus Roizmanbacteria bacterium CG_4_10_14_0_8_um_filter_36_36]PJA53665.1 MAG: hypothetical protein CO166_00775 [Candidatus Roizmanbacteria bacterium CG_4_9_14_3_um_filter_36_11]